MGSLQSLIDAESSAPAIKQGRSGDGIWRDQSRSSVGALSTNT